MRIEIGIPTYNRPRILGRCLAALLSQTYTEWDLTVINDSPDVPFDPITLRWLGMISDAGHRVQVVEAGRWGQVAAHNWALYHTEHEAILRLDDDIILNRDALYHLAVALEDSPTVGAVAGLYFYPDERYEMPEDWADDPKADGQVREELNSHFQQVAYHFSRGNEAQWVEHLYSSCLYRTKAMRYVGGWPEVYSLGVACGEETEGTYKMHLAGWELYIVPMATGVHLWAEGGIRSKGQDHVEVNYQRDTRLFISRLPELRATNWHSIKVGIYGQFQYGIGGAQKLFYQLVSLLQGSPDLDVYPLFRGPYWSSEEAEELFGCRYQMRAEPPQVDVQIAIGHRVLLAIPAGRYIQYTLFPDPSGDLNVPAQFVGISPFTSEWTGKLWGKTSRTICPLVQPMESAEDKENWILIVGRLEPAKAYKELIQTFLEMELEGWELHIVGADTQGVHDDYEAEIARLAEEHSNIVLHYDISQAELHELYGKAKVLWAAKGIRAHEGKGYHPNLCEHFGYTIIEAATAGCVPIAYDDGGHQYTVLAECCWKTLEDLKSITSRMVRESFLEEIRPRVKALAKKFTDEAAFVEAWIRLIRRVNGMALDCREPRIKVQDRPLKIGCIVDHPSLTTGFGVVARQILAGFHQAGYQVSALGGGSPDDPRFGADLPYPVWRCIGHAVDGSERMGSMLRHDEPDVLWICHDIGEVGEWIVIARQQGFEGPIMAYFPVEGLPIWRGFTNIINATDIPITWLSFGAKAIQKEIGRPVEWLPLGVDHAPFRRFPDSERQELRRAIGWDKKFVVGYVGRNKGTKAQWRLIHAVSFLKRMGMDDLLVYFHCRPTEGGWNEGYDLEGIRAQQGVEDMVIFPPVDTPAGHGPPFTGGEGQTLADYSLDQIYNCLDFYVHPSEIEGFGLPILEAMACGVPVAVTNDQLAMTEVADDAAILMAVESKSMWYTMALKANVSPRTIAYVIVKAREDLEKLASLAELGQRRAAQFKWQPTCDKMVEIVAKGYQAWQQR